MTTTVTIDEGQVCVFIAVDHCTAECVGIHAAKSGNRFEALEPIRQGVREPEDNGCAERFIRTLKDNLLWVRSFATVAALAEALREFRRRYNEQWLIQRHGYRTPSEVRHELIGGTLAVA